MLAAVALLPFGAASAQTVDAAQRIVVLSGALHLVYNLSLQKGYQVADLSVVYPIARGTGPLFSTLGAFLVLGETPTVHGLLGAAAFAVESFGPKT